MKNKKVNTILVSGGVSANRRLREKFDEISKKENVKVIFPKLEYCTDNAAMIGSAAYYKLKNNLWLDYEIDIYSIEVKYNFSKERNYLTFDKVFVCGA